MIAKTKPNRFCRTSPKNYEIINISKKYVQRNTELTFCKKLKRETLRIRTAKTSLKINKIISTMTGLMRLISRIISEITIL